MKKLILPIILAAGYLGASAQYSHTVQAEALNRGLVAVKADNGVFVSWRSLVTDDKTMTFDIYRDGVKLNDEPITNVTGFSDSKGTAGATYQVKCYVNGNEVDSQTVSAWDSAYKRVHLDRPAGGTSPAGGTNEDRNYTYTPDDVSVGDVDGDGEYELFVKWFPTNAADNSFYRYTGNTIIDCYKLDGTKLWRIDLGHNIRSGNHYTQFMVWDFNGDGKAEMIVKTAPGTIDGTGKAVLMGSDKVTDDYRNSRGHVISGSEYLTVFDGQTGAEIHTIAYNPPHDVRKFDSSASGWGDSYGGRSERYLACVAYLDGEHPSAVFCRGYYTAAYLWAVDFDGTKLTERWLHKSETKGQGVYGQGCHSLTVGDVDGDGYDEIIYGSGAVDHDGKFLHSTGMGHGDALHLADMIVEREGLEVFMPHEEKTVKTSHDIRDARTGEILFYLPQTGEDNGRGLAANICEPAGYEYWSSKQRLPENSGVSVGSKSPSVNFRVYWDGDLYDELLDGTTITKPNKTNSSISTIREFSGFSNATSCNSTKKTPNLSADILGDWREEVILHDSSTESDLLIFSTVTPTSYKVPCLMQDRQYREAIAWQNVAYNQPPHLSYNLQELFNNSAAITLTEGSVQQVVNVGEEMAPIRFAVKRATGVQLTMGPQWLVLNFDAETLTGSLTGVPTVEGEFRFRLQTVGSADGVEATLEGRLIIRRNQTLVPMAQFSFERCGEYTPNTVYGEALAAASDVAVTEGKKGNAAHLDNNYFVQAGYEALDFGAGDFTIELWMRSTDDAAYFLHKGSLKNDGASHTGHWVGLELKNNSLKFGIDDDVTKTDLTVAEANKWMDGEWHHIVAVRDTYMKKILLYVDGALAGENADATGAINCVGEDLVIGNVNVDFNNYFIGDIDELTIYRGSMTAAKVLERYETTGTELAYLPMDELSTSTPNLVHGQAEVVGSGLELVEGLKGGAIKFNDSAYLQQQAYEAIQMGENDFSIEFWMKSTDADGYIFFKGSHARNEAQGTTGHWIGIERKSGYLTFTIDDDSKKTDCKLSSADYAFDGKWHHIAAVRSYADKSMALYIDGEQVAIAANVATTGLFDNNEPMRIGNSDETAREFNGVIDELVIRPKAMTDAEVLESYEQLKDRAAGIADVMIDKCSTPRYMVVDAFTGIVLREAIGHDRHDIVEGIDKGVYILVIVDGDKVENLKFVKR